MVCVWRNTIQRRDQSDCEGSGSRVGLGTAPYTMPISKSSPKQFFFRLYINCHYFTFYNLFPFNGIIFLHIFSTCSIKLPLMSKIQFDNGVMILSAVDPLSNRMSIQILQLPQPPKLEPLDFLFESVSSHRKRVRPSKETRAIVERELMIVRSNSKFTEHFAPPLPIMAGTRPISTSSYESTQTSSQGTTSSQSTRRRRPSLGLVQRLFASNEPEPEPLGKKQVTIFKE